MHLLVLAAMFDTDVWACCEATELMSVGTVVDGTLPIGPSHVGSTTGCDGMLKASEPNACPGDFEM